MTDKWDWLAYATPAERAELSDYVAESAGVAWAGDWSTQARPEQTPPPGDWRVWLVMAGRGFGKTRTGAEWVRAIAEAEPAARIAIVAASLVEARADDRGRKRDRRVQPARSPSKVRTFAAPGGLAQWSASRAVLGGRARIAARPPAQPRMV